MGSPMNADALINTLSFCQTVVYHFIILTMFSTISCLQTSALLTASMILGHMVMEGILTACCLRSRKPTSGKVHRNKQFTVVENPGLWCWTFTLKDANGDTLAQVDRDWRGFGFEETLDVSSYKSADQ
ncbi:hypothetical protein RND81_14G108700 [Saponaria officinalis]|uniref:Phospholipid scramblase n=1 Tax=Saponaria officinalis TaxID=3572 RepID=A0AAW1GP01_SAPOF